MRLIYSLELNWEKCYSIRLPGYFTVLSTIVNSNKVPF
jgi:hypothetical protein